MSDTSLYKPPQTVGMLAKSRVIRMMKYEGWAREILATVFSFSQYLYEWCLE